MNDYAQIGVAGIFVLMLLDKILPYLKGRNGGQGASELAATELAARQTQILEKIQLLQEETAKAVARLVWIAEEESKYYRTRNGK